MVRAYVQGTGFSGIIASGLSASTKAAFSDALDGLHTSARVFFIASSSLCWICVVVYKCAIEKGLNEMTTPSLSSSQQERMPLLDESLETARSEDEDGTWRRTVKKMTLAIVNMFLTNFVFSVMFPGVGSDAKVRLPTSPQEPLLVAFCAE